MPAGFAAIVVESVANAARPAEAIAMSAPPDSVSQAAPAEHCRLKRNEIKPAATVDERAPGMGRVFMGML
jgi:hypothetical protein